MGHWGYSDNHLKCDWPYSESIMCAYGIFSKSTGEVLYIGGTKDIYSRRVKHRFKLKNNIHPNKKLQYHVNSVGILDLSFDILMTVSDESRLREAEQFCLDLFNPLFNICKFANSSKGRKHTPESKRKLSIAGKGRKHSIESKNIMREKMLKYIAENGHPSLGKKHKSKVL